MKIQLSATPRGILASACISMVLAAPLVRAADAAPVVAKPTVNAPVTITDNGEEADLRERLSAPSVNPTQSLYVSAGLPQTGRVMVKDENVCVHCGLCAERCPTAAWDMEEFELLIPYAVDSGVLRIPVRRAKTKSEVGS